MAIGQLSQSRTKPLKPKAVAPAAAAASLSPWRRQSRKVKTRAESTLSAAVTPAAVQIENG